MDELKDKGKKVIENIGEKRSDMLQKWEEKSRDFIDAFLLLFGREGRLSHIWAESKGRLMQALSPPSSPKLNGSPSSSTNSLNGDSLEIFEDALPPPRKTPRFDGITNSSRNFADSFYTDEYSDEEENQIASLSK